MSTVKSKKLQVGTDASASNNFTIYQPATPDGTLRIGVGNADSPTEVGQFNANGYKPQQPVTFSATNNSSQSISASVYTKIAFQNVEWDSNNNYDNSTYTFTPTVAGYYQIIGGTYILNSHNRLIFKIYKNGSSWKTLYDRGTTSETNVRANGSAIVYCNGTTDYINLYLYTSTTSIHTAGDSVYFQAFLISQA